MKETNLILAVLGGQAFWAFLTVLWKAFAERRKTAAETESSIVQNWVTWAQHQETRIRELESTVLQLSEAGKAKDELLARYRAENEELKQKLSVLEARFDRVLAENKKLKGQ